ncbi:MAG: hypothetical protein KTR18_07245 [Acidiferrobacterales bacterium]|nr:hypothetical protein [Acidiferrobacterales bacterium]
MNNVVLQNDSEVTIKQSNRIAGAVFVEYESVNVNGGVTDIQHRVCDSTEINRFDKDSSQSKPKIGRAIAGGCFNSGFNT